MAKFTKEENARTLKAWNAWKEVCWVHGLGKPRGDQPVVGTDADETLLSDMISNAFRRQLDPYVPQLEALAGRDFLSNIDYAQEFDDALCEYEHVNRYKKGYFGDMTKLRKKKAWKNIVWLEVAQSKDPPLKVILGRLLSTRKGVIRDLVKEWVLSNFSCDEKKTADGKSVMVFDHSRDAEMERCGEKVAGSVESDGFSAGEAAVMECISPGSMHGPGNEEFDSGSAVSAGRESISDLAIWRQELEQSFSPLLCCLIFAHINGVKLYADTEILGALGISKTTAANDLKKAKDCLSSLSPELRDWIVNDDSGTRFFRNWIENRCRTEKAGVLILSRMEEQKWTMK